MQFGSLQNMVAAGCRGDRPEVGMGATILGWTDRHAATVVAVSASGTSVEIQRDRALRTDDNGLSESGQTYEFTPDPDAEVITYTLRSNGRWVRRGDEMHKGSVLLIGSRDEYYDFSF